MAIVLTGCAQIDYQVTVNRDGSGKIVYTYVMDRTVLEQQQRDAEYIVSEMKDKAVAAGFTVEDYFSDRFEGFRATKEMDDITEVVSLANIFGEDNVRELADNNIVIERGMFLRTYSQQAVIDLSAIEVMAQYGGIVDYSITLPTRAGANNATTVSGNGRTLTWELVAGEENRVEFVAQELTITAYVFILIGIGLAVVSVVMIRNTIKAGKEQEEIE